MINPYAIGTTIYLRAPRREDIDGNWYQWFSDPDVTQYLADRWWPNSVDDQVRFFETLSTSKDRLVLSICLVETDQHIGVCNLSSISWVHRNADIALVIGEKPFRNGVIAVEAYGLVLDVAFNRLNLLNIRSSYISANPYTPLLERLFGFREAGRFKQYAFFRGAYVDVVWSQLSRADWADRNK